MKIKEKTFDTGKEEVTIFSQNTGECIKMMRARKIKFLALDKYEVEYYVWEGNKVLDYGKEIWHKNEYKDQRKEFFAENINQGA